MIGFPIEQGTQFAWCDFFLACRADDLLPVPEDSCEDELCCIAIKCDDLWGLCGFHYASLSMSVLHTRQTVFSEYHPDRWIRDQSGSWTPKKHPVRVPRYAHLKALTTMKSITSMMKKSNTLGHPILQLVQKCHLKLQSVPLPSVAHPVGRHQSFHPLN